jgi:hypothetical protein
VGTTTHTAAMTSIVFYSDAFFSATFPHVSQELAGEKTYTKNKHPNLDLHKHN